jgi:hypothetical protein
MTERHLTIPKAIAGATLAGVMIAGANVADSLSTPRPISVEDHGRTVDLPPLSESYPTQITVTLPTETLPTQTTIATPESVATTTPSTEAEAQEEPETTTSTTTTTTVAPVHSTTTTEDVPEETAPEIVEEQPTEETIPETPPETTPEIVTADTIDPNIMPVYIPPIITPEIIIDTVPDTTPDTTEETTPPVLEILPVHAVPIEVSNIMQQETVYLPWVGCSGALIRDENGKPIGVSFNEHCAMRPQNRERILGTDGNFYFLDQDFTVTQGDSVDKMTKVGNISQFILNPADDTTRDEAIGVFEGHTQAEVVANLKLASPDQILALQKNDVMYMSGFPVDQDNNPGPMKRQEFALSILGNGLTKTTLGETIDVVWAAVPSTPDGAECSFGASGSMGFIMVDGKALSVGNLAAFYDLTGDTSGTPEQAQRIKKILEEKWGVSLDGFTTICGFAKEQPDTLISVADSIVDVPGHENDPQPEATYAETYKKLQKKFVRELNNPAIDKTFLDGWIELPMRGGGGEGAEKRWVEDPLIYNPGDGNLLISWRDPDFPDKINSRLLFKGTFETIDFWREPGAPEDYSPETHGALTEADFNGDQALQDENGNIIAYRTANLPENPTPLKLFVDTRGVVQVIPTEGPGAP